MIVIMEAGGGDDGFPISYFKMHFSAINSACFWQNERPIQAPVLF